jgi:hypothetical protein
MVAMNGTIARRAALAGLVTLGACMWLAYPASAAAPIPGVLVPGRLADALGPADAQYLFAVSQVEDPTPRQAYQIHSLADPRLVGATFPAGAAVMYDLERTLSTPASELVDPQASLMQFVELAHSNGYEAIIAPARNLIRSDSEGCYRELDESAWQAYLRCVASVPADGLLVQAQRFQCTNSWTNRFLAAAAVQPGWTWGETSLRPPPGSAMGGCIDASVIEYLMRSLQGNAGLSMWGVTGWPSSSITCLTADIRCESDQIAIAQGVMSSLATR